MGVVKNTYSISFMGKGILLILILSLNINTSTSQCVNNLFVNGSFTSQVGDVLTAPGWTIAAVTPDVNDASGTLHTTTGYSWTGTPIPSSNGGTWQNIFGTEAFQQTVNTVIGKEYRITFEYAAQGISAGSSMTFNGPAGVDVYINNQLAYSTPLDVTQYSWESATYTFTATTSVTTIMFKISQTEYVGIDGACMVLTSDNNNIPVFAYDICQGSSITLHNKTYTAAGTYSDTLTNSMGGDSIISIKIAVDPKYAKSQTMKICQGESINVGAHTYTQTGNYTDSLKTTKGCDSIIVTNLTVNSVKSVAQNVTICPGGKYVIGTHTYTQQGTYKDTLQTSLGCDSVITTTVSIASLQTVTRNVSICSGEKLIIGTHTYTTNGIYKDTIIGGTNCDTVLITNLAVFPKPIVHLGNIYLVCPDSVITLDAGNAGATYVWNNGNTTQQITPTNEGSYTVTVTKDNCSTRDTIIIQYKPVYKVNLGEDAVLCNKDTIVLNVTTPGGSYIWQDASSLPVYSIKQEGIYYVQVLTECSVSSDTISIVYEECDCQYYVPSAFSPNNDEINDVFGPVNQCTGVSFYKLEIYNRWGEQVFQSGNENDKWNGIYKGATQPLDDYVYILTYRQNNKDYYQKGTLSLLK